MRSLARWSARSPVAANVIMLLILVGGLFSLKEMRREFFPEFSLDIIVVAVPYPGASPEEVERGICIKIEEAIEGVAGIKRLTSSAGENRGSVVAELEVGADANQVYNDIKNEVEQIFTFPVEAERPSVQLATIRNPAITVVVYGDESESVMRVLGEKVRTTLTSTDDISYATLGGTRMPEISIELREDDLRRYGLSFEDVYRKVSENSLDLPAGKIKTSGGEILVRAKGQRYHGAEFEKIPLLTLPDGAIVRLGEVADVVDGFDDQDIYARFKGKRAVTITLVKTATQDLFKVVDSARAVVEKIRPSLPAGVEIETCFDSSKMLNDRIELLTRNGLQGLVLVFISLCLFLRMRLAFWVAMGIPISFMGAFVILIAKGQTINMISAFSFIMALGIVVDDAIIVGENIFAHFRNGKSPFQAAVDGAAEVGWPVVASVTTTIIAFAPLLFMSGIMGKFFAVIPMVVIATLVVSLLEAFVILPAHLDHSMQKSLSHSHALEKPGWRTHVIDVLIRKIYLPFFITPAIRYRYIATALAFSGVLLCFGLVAGGRINFTVFPKVDTDDISAEVYFPEGTPVAVTEAAVDRLEASFRHVADEARAELPEESRDAGVLRTLLSLVGEVARTSSEAGQSGSNMGQIQIELLPMEEMGGLTSSELINRWREDVGGIPGAERVLYHGSEVGPGGKPVEVQLLGHDFDELEGAAEMLKDKLATYQGVYDISDSFSPGKWEIKIKAKPQALNLGLSLGEIARQVRYSFYGAEAQRIQRGRDEVKVMVRYTAEERKLRSTLENMRIRVARPLLGRGSGQDFEGNYYEVPLSEVAEVDFGRGYSTISRFARQRSITVTADLDETKANASQILSDLRVGHVAEKPDSNQGPVAAIKALFSTEKKADQAVIAGPQGYLYKEVQHKYPGVNFAFEGQARQTRESVGSLKYGFLCALIGIYCLLAAQFRSYVQPVVVMCAIPVSLIGVLFGHVVMGMDLTLLSLTGVVALAGIVVNDSLVLIDFINRRIRSGVAPEQAVVESGEARFRAIILTSMTTVAGLLPLLMERSMQAQFLKPMAVSIAFGLSAATLLTLVVTPCIYMIVADIKGLFGLPVVEAIPDDNEADGRHIQQSQSS